jgi:hypothetical protein
MSGDEFVDGDLLESGREDADGERVAERELDRETHEIDERLRDLRKQQEEVEHRRSELEELRRRQEVYGRHRGQVTEALSNGLITLERGIAATSDRLEWMHETRSRFRDLLGRVQAIDDKSWTPETLSDDLATALALLEEARTEYARVQHRLEDPEKVPAPPEPEPVSGETPAWAKDFGFLFKVGWVVALPLAVILGICLIVLAIILTQQPT